MLLDVVPSCKLFVTIFSGWLSLTVFAERAPARFSLAVKTCFDYRFPGLWSCRCGPQNWPEFSTIEVASPV